jgi:lipoprotein-releasing system ATP-binding protein
MAEPVLELRGVTKDYGEHVITRVLHGVDLTVAAGELLALVGPSGSGKSTLLNIMGLLDRPTSGSLHVAGQDTRDLADDELSALRGQVLGFVFQFHHLLPAFTALENVILPLYGAAGLRDAAMDRRGAELLARVGLEGFESNLATDLSGGQQQRVAIARALARSPRVVLADEPTGNLDTHTADQVFAMLRELNAREGTALVVVTHDPRLAARCDRVVELVDGQVVRDTRSGAP